jgi:hypothetical protein
MIKTSIYFFLMILVAALASSVLGGVFGLCMSVLSPEFISDLFAKNAGQPVGGYAFTVDMVWGLFIGAAVAGFCCGLAVVLKVIRLWIDIGRANLERKSDHSAGAS